MSNAIGGFSFSFILPINLLPQDRRINSFSSLWYVLIIPYGRSQLHHHSHQDSAGCLCVRDGAIAIRRTDGYVQPQITSFRANSGPHVTRPCSLVGRDCRHVDHPFRKRQPVRDGVFPCRHSVKLCYRSGMRSDGVRGNYS